MPSLIERRLEAGRNGSGLPGAGRGLVRREALFDRLSATQPGGLVLVCAPAGSGKTALLRSWVDAAGLHDQVAWMSVARGERDAQRFWLSVIDGLADVVPAVRRVEPAPGFNGDAVVDQLMDDLATVEEPSVLVIDDLHELDSRQALAWLESFLEQLPRVLRVVLATREDPRLSLHRLRLTGELTELRAADLCFSEVEAKELLRASGVTLSDGAMELLYERAEGWAAALRLAAISLAHHPDPERFVAEFSGSERTVASYLLAEVLERQPQEVRELLLRTAVLERVNGPLADHLTGGSGAERLLQELEDANAFVTSLDVGRTWFRYHHLFADLLRMELRRAAPSIVGMMHRAGAEWYEQEGYVVEAVRHAQDARDWTLASRLLSDHHLELTLDGGTATVGELLSAFPDRVTGADPGLALVFATARLLEQDLDRSAAYVDLAQRLADEVPRERRQSFDVLLAVLRLLLARWRGDLETVLEALPTVEAKLAAQPAGEQSLSHELRSVALENLGIAELWSSRFEDARGHLEQALALARRAGRPWLELADLGHLAIVAACTGQSLTAALELSEQAVKIADARGWSEDRALLTAFVSGAMALLWLGRLEEAEQWLQRGGRALQAEGEPATELVLHHCKGLMSLTRGNLDAALQAFEAAERMQGLLAGRHAFTVSVRARLLQTRARMGELATARAALDDLSEEERDTCEVGIAMAALHLAGDEPEQAIEALRDVIEGSAPAIHRQSAMTEAQLLDAVAREQLGDQRAAEVSLERALELAEPEGILLPFSLVPVADLLEQLPQYRTAHATLRQTILDALAGSAPIAEAHPGGLFDELSEAELRVVRYLPSNLRAPEIAAELFVSTNTIRTHLRHIYQKLGTHNRADAVARARQLGLLAPSARRG